MTQTLVGSGAAGAMLPKAFRLVGLRHETSDTVTLVFEDPAGEEVTFAPGQFMMLYIYGVGEVPISIAGNPHVHHSLEHTVRAVGAVTDAICSLEVGDVVGIRGPYGTAWPVSDAEGDDLLFVPGGIGLAPLRPAILEALNNHDLYRSVSLLYGARSPGELLYKDDLLGWALSPHINLEVTVDRATTDWWGDVGLVTMLLNRVTFEPEATTAFVCGPEVMMRVVARELEARGVPSDKIWISLERNMKCAIGFCGHCQYGSDFLCKTGPVVRYDQFATRLGTPEI